MRPRPTGSYEGPRCTRGPSVDHTLARQNERLRAVAQARHALNAGLVQHGEQEIGHGRPLGIPHMHAALDTLHAAAYAGFAPVAALLLQKGAAIEDVQNKAHATPLMVAADEGRIEVVELLLAQGANLNTLDKDGFSPLTQAWSKKHLDVVHILKRRGATCQSVEVLGSEDYYRQCAEAGN